MMPLAKVTDMSFQRSPVGRILGYGEFGWFFPLLITAAGTARTAKVLVLGTEHSGPLFPRCALAVAGLLRGDQHGDNAP
jgi:hypothetical protein